MTCSKHNTKSRPRKTHWPKPCPSSTRCSHNAPRTRPRTAATRRQTRVRTPARRGQRQTDQRPAGQRRTDRRATRTGTTPSAADLASYQQAVDSAEANLAVAQQAQAQATIVSPIDGTVIAVNMNPGDSVTAGSTTATIVVAGSGGYEAVTMVKVTDLPKLKVGQAASVQPDGSAHHHRPDHQHRARQHQHHDQHDLPRHHQSHRRHQSAAQRWDRINRDHDRQRGQRPHRPFIGGPRQQRHVHRLGPRR